MSVPSPSSSARAPSPPSPSPPPFRPPIPLPFLPPSRSTCTLCPLSTVARSPGIGCHHLPTSLSPTPSTPALLIIGQNPGYHEDTRATPFIGKSGELLQGPYLSGVSLPSLCSIFVTNTARCYHRDGDGPSNAHYRACRPYLFDDIRALLPHCSRLFILCLGAPATTHTYALLGIPRVTLTSSFTHQARTLPCPSNEPGTATATPSPSAAAATRARRRASTASSATKPAAPTPGETAASNATNVSEATTPLAPSPMGTSPSAAVVAHEAANVTLFSTFHPAAVLRTGNLIHAVAGHMTLLAAHIRGEAPVPSTPLFVPPFPPPRR